MNSSSPRNGGAGSAMGGCARPWRSIEIACGCLVFASGAVLSYFYGRVGYMPMDQSIVFDGGWRILNGQTPYADFFSPTSIVPSIIQALYFRLFGVDWFAYLLHAATFNGFFGVVVYRVLRLCEVGPGAAVTFGLASVVSFYPPIGTPYGDQHAFFFLLVCFWILLEVSGRSRASQLVVAGLIPLAAGLAFLSKQVPTLPGLIVLVPGLLLLPPKDRRRACLGAAIGATVLALITGGWLIAHEVALAGSLFQLRPPSPSGSGPSPPVAAAHGPGVEVGSSCSHRSRFGLLDAAARDSALQSPG